MDQRGSDQRLARQDGGVIAWTSKAGGATYLALFNTQDSPAAVKSGFASYGLANGKYSVRNIWESKDLGRTEAVEGTIAPHGCLLLELRR
jgi:hypothetical protein